MDTKTRSIEWSDLESGVSKGKFNTRFRSNGDYVCPTCGETCTYNEGQIDQLENGWDIHGWWFDCYTCKITSEPVEGRWNGDDYD